MEYTMKRKWSGAKRAVAVSVAMLVAVPLAACSSGDGSGGGKTTITFSYLWGGAEAKSLEKIISDFNDSQKDIKVVGVSSPDQQKQLTSMSSSNGSFDISDNFGNSVGAWASKGILAPLDDYIDANKIDTDDFVPSAMDQMVYEGKTYALPIAVHSVQLVYNKKLLDEAGVQPPKTMDELAAAAKALTKTDASGNITQLGLGDANITTTLTTLAFAYGGAWDGKKGPTPMDDGNIAALQWYQDNVVRPVGADKLAAFVGGEGQYLSAQDPLYSGKMAMRIDGEWTSVSAAKAAPDLDWGVTAIPTAKSGIDNATLVSSSTLFIPANSKHKEEAAAFLAYLVSKKPMTDFSLALGNLPARTSLLDSDAYSGLKNFDVWAAALKSPAAQSTASKPYSAEYASDLEKAFDKIERDAATPEDALKDVQSRVSSYATH
jgi:multiple sugar transport system substrate-binding protein